MLKKTLLLTCLVSFFCFGQPHDKYEKVVWGLFAVPPAVWFGSSILEYQAKKQAYPYNNMTHEKLEQWKKYLETTKKISGTITAMEAGGAVIFKCITPLYFYR